MQEVEILLIINGKIFSSSSKLLKDLIIVSGPARDADQLGERFAKKHNLKLKVVLVNRKYSTIK